MNAHPDIPKFSGTRPRPAMPRTATTQPADGPGVTWWRDMPWCSTCATPLNDTNTCHNDGTLAMRPLTVRTCPMCDGSAA